MSSVVLLKSRLSHQGGLEKYTRRLAEAFVNKGCHVTLLTTGPYFSLEKVEVVSLGKTLKLSIRHLQTFDNNCMKWLEAHKPSIIFGMERNSFQTHYRAGSGVHAAYLKKRALTDSWLKQFSFSINPLHRYLLKTEKKAFESPDLKVLFTNSHMVKNEILQTYSTPPDKIRVVHNGVEWVEKEGPFLESFSPNFKKKGLFHFLFVGNGFKRKGLEFLLKGLSGLNEPYQLTVVGTDKNFSKYKNLAKGLNVKFVGAQPDVTPFYQKADALIIPSIYDPFSNVTLEGLAMGLFVVTSKNNGGHEVLQENTGTIIDFSNPQEALKKALKFPKTLERATSIRQSIKELDFSIQLDKIVSQSLC